MKCTTDKIKAINFECKDFSNNALRNIEFNEKQIKVFENKVLIIKGIDFKGNLIANEYSRPNLKW